jgi:hypothetical protein
MTVHLSTLGRKKNIKNRRFNELQFKIAPALSVASPRPEPVAVDSRGFSQSTQTIDRPKRQNKY